MLDLLSSPWPWWVTGPLIGLFVPLLLVVGNKTFGVSRALRHTCAAILPATTDFLRYDWKREGGWHLAFAAGIVLGGLLGGWVFANPVPIAISEATHTDLIALGVSNFTGLVPEDVFSWTALGTLRGWILLAGGGLLIGFGTAWGGGCTSGHGITGIGNLQLPSFIATLAFFAGGIAATFLLLPLLLGGPVP
jgi:uncharacterized membrane protein YedE/YeeE